MAEGKVNETRDQSPLLRAVDTIVVGILVGAFLTGLLAAAQTPFLPMLSHNLSPIIWYPFFFVGMILLVGSFSLMLWVPGILIFGMPLLMLLHRLGFRKWPYPTLAGAVLIFAINYGIFRDHELWLGPFFHNDRTLGRIEHAAFMAVIGALTTLAMWRTASSERQSATRSPIR